jgi:5-methylthioribose kinase
MKLETEDLVKEYLTAGAIVNNKDKISVENLSGGVSSLVWKITFENNRWVIKQALEKLNVKEDWFSDVQRIHREHEVMEAIVGFVPDGAIPKVLHVDYVNHVYIMTCAEEGSRTWKDMLMQGEFSDLIAGKAGSLLRGIHQYGNNIEPGRIAKFLDQEYFVQLRVDPFHHWLMQKYPGLSSYIQKLIDQLTHQKTCLVHGDFSPKNMLIEKDESIVLIDFEVAHWGNPVFDIAYCIGHLMLKGWHLQKKENALKLIEVFLASYGQEVRNIIPHLGLMLLARMDGKSPVDYIHKENLKNVIRKAGVKWIGEKIEYSDTLQNIRKAFETE